MRFRNGFRNGDDSLLPSKKGRSDSRPGNVTWGTLPIPADQPNRTSQGCAGA